MNMHIGKPLISITTYIWVKEEVTIIATTTKKKIQKLIGTKHDNKMEMKMKVVDF